VQAAVAQVMSHEHDSCIAFESLFTLAQEEQTDQHPLLGMKSIMDPDSLYLWEARKEKDFPNFLEAMQKEIDDPTKEGHWKLVRQSKLPKGATVLPAVWSMKCKRRIAAREVYKWKARLNVDGSKQKPGVHFDETYSPVVAWPTTRFFLIQALINKWKTKQLDFVLAYPQPQWKGSCIWKYPKG